VVHLSAVRSDDRGQLSEGGGGGRAGVHFGHHGHRWAGFVLSSPRHLFRPSLTACVYRVSCVLCRVSCVANMGRRTGGVQRVRFSFVALGDPTSRSVVDLFPVGARRLRDQYMKTGQGFLLAYSVTSTESFEAAAALRSHIMRIKEDEPDVSHSAAFLAARWMIDESLPRVSCRVCHVVCRYRWCWWETRSIWRKSAW